MKKTSESRIEWRTERKVVIGHHSIYCAENMEVRDDAGAGLSQIAGIRRSPISLKSTVKRYAFPLLEIYGSLMVDGFIERWIAKRINQLARPSSVLLEFGCGRGRLVRLLPDGVAYNGFDIAFSELQVNRLLRQHPEANLCLADATAVPIGDSTVDIVVSTEVFEHIPKIREALGEVVRVSKTNAILLCSIPNNFCSKYQKKGPHADHVNNWTFSEFTELLAEFGFVSEEAIMKGWWIPFPARLVRGTYQLPLSTRSEAKNTNFLFQFRLKK